MTTKVELDAEVVKLNGIDLKFARLLAAPATSPFIDEELWLLRELLRGHVTETVNNWRRQRLEMVIDILFPSFNSLAPKSEYPIRHPIKADWWNGATIVDWSPLEDGDISVDLTSYVGGGHTDTLDGFVVLKDWLEAEDMQEKLHNYCKRISQTRR